MEDRDIIYNKIRVRDKEVEVPLYSKDSWENDMLGSFILHAMRILIGSLCTTSVVSVRIRRNFVKNTYYLVCIKIPVLYLHFEPLLNKQRDSVS